MIRAVAIAAGLALTWAACSERGETFRVVSLSPDPGAGPIRLNEPIVARFSAVVDPSSVGERSFAFRAADGALARGSLRVVDDTVTFLPDPPARPDFTDAGFAPGARYVLALSGFPARDGVFSAAGDPLGSPFRAEYVALEPPIEASGATVFVDPRPSRPPALENGERLRVAGDSVAPDGAIALEFSEPLLPGSVSARAFDLRFDNPEREKVPFTVAFEQGRARAVVRLRPEGGFRPDTAYLLLLDPPMKLLDLVGNPIDEFAPIAFRCTEGGRRELGRSDAGAP